MGQAAPRPGRPGATSERVVASAPSTQEALLASALARKLSDTLPSQFGHQVLDTTDPHSAPFIAKLAAREAQLSALPQAELRLALDAVAEQLESDAGAAAASLDHGDHSGDMDYDDRGGGYGDDQSQPQRKRKAVTMASPAAAAAQAAAFEGDTRRIAASQLRGRGLMQDLLEQGGPCERDGCSTRARVLAFIGGDNGALLCAACDRTVHLHRRASHRWTLVHEDGCTRSILRQLAADEFWPTAMEAGGAADDSVAGIERVVVALSVASLPPCSCGSIRVVASSWSTSAVDVYDLNRGHYRGGYATKVACRSCSTERLVVGPPVSRLGPDLVPLTASNVGSAILQDDLVYLRRLHAEQDRGLSVGMAVKLYAAACGGLSPPVAALRRVVYADRAVDAFAFAMLRGGSIVPCLACGLCGDRVWIDGNFAVSCNDRGGAVTSWNKPGGLMLDTSVARGIEAESLSAQGERGGGNCYGADWLAASSSSRANTAHAFEGVMVAACSHEQTVLAAPCSRGEVKSYHVAIILWACLLGCLLIILDVWCRDFAHMRLQTAADLGYFDRLLRVLVGAPGGGLPSSVRIRVPAPGNGPNPPITISIQHDDAAQESALAAADGAVAMAAAGSSAGAPPLSGLPRDGAREGIVAVLRDMLLAAVVVTIASGVGPWGRVTHPRGGIPAMHEYAHGCKDTHGTSGLPHSGALGEVVERVNVSISALSSLVYSMSPMHWLLTIEERLMQRNERRHAEMATALTRAYVRLRHRAERQRAVLNELLDAAESWNGSRPTDRDIQQWADERSQRAEEPRADRSPNDVRAALLTKVTQLGEVRAVLAAAVDDAEQRARAPSRHKRPRPLGSDSRGTDVADAFFAAAIAASKPLRTIINAKTKKGQFPITDIVTARTRILDLDVRIGDANKTLGRGPPVNVDDRLVAAMRQLRRFADLVCQLRPPPGTAAALQPRSESGGRRSALVAQVKHMQDAYDSVKTLLPFTSTDEARTFVLPPFESISCSDDLPTHLGPLTFSQDDARRNKVIAAHFRVERTLEELDMIQRDAKATAQTASAIVSKLTLQLQRLTVGAAGPDADTIKRAMGRSGLAVPALPAPTAADFSIVRACADTSAYALDSANAAPTCATRAVETEPPPPSRYLHAATQGDKGRAQCERHGLFSLEASYQQPDDRRQIASGCAAIVSQGLCAFRLIALQAARAADGLAALHAVRGDLYVDALRRPSLNLYVTALLNGTLSAEEWASCAGNARPVRVDAAAEADEVEAAGDDDVPRGEEDEEDDGEEEGLLGAADAEGQVGGGDYEDDLAGLLEELRRHDVASDAVDSDADSEAEL